MSESRLPQFGSMDELVDFFDSHDMGELWDEMPEADFEVNVHRRTFLVAVDGELMKKVSQLAKAQNTTTESLINAWLEERVARAA